MNYEKTTNNQYTVPVFRPTYDEFKDFPKYIDYIESMGAHKIGLAKIIPPKEWVSRRGGYNDLDGFKISSPISQRVTGREGIYTQYNIQQKSMKLKEFQKLANSSKYCTPNHSDNNDLERKYWKNLTFIPPLYGADISGSLTDPEQPYWNISKLGTILDDIRDEYHLKIEGVNTAYLYFGMWKSTFAWHTEDMDLYSINYLHFGAPKSWYVIPPEHGKRLERLAENFFPQIARDCNAFLRHKMTIISPRILNKYSIPYSKVTQNQNEFIITFPYGYHSGYNHGFNCAESTNFAMPRWIDYGKRATQCYCCKDMVKIKMDIFVKKYQPDKYDLWMLGMDKSTVKVNTMDKQQQQSRDNMDVDESTSNSDENRTGYIGKRRFQISSQCNTQNSKRIRLGSASGTTFAEYFNKLSLINSDTLISRRETNSLVDDTVRIKVTASITDYNLPGSLYNCLTNGLTMTDGGSLKHQCAIKCLELLKRISNSDYADAECGDDEQPIVTKTTKSDTNRKHKSNTEFANGLNNLKCINAYEDYLSTSTVHKDKLERLNGLWNFQNLNREKIREFNLNESYVYPHCSICLMFKNNNNNQTKRASSTMMDDAKATEKLLPKNSEISTSEICFTKHSKNLLNLSDYQRDNIDCLLQCKQCSVTVHQSCYFGFMDDDLTLDKQNWMCNSCLVANYENAYCCLCMLRGGALKQTTDKRRWAHVTCALCIENVSFKDSQTRSIIQVPKQLLHDKKIQKCGYCNYFSKYNNNDTRGLTIKCTDETCKTRFHVTCGQVFGCLFENVDWPVCIQYLCDKHAAKRLENYQWFNAKQEIPFEIETEIELDAKENGFLKRAKIIERVQQVFYEVDFGDGTYSSDMPPEDIESELSDQQTDGIPIAGSTVKVKWTDGEVYNCTFLGSNKTYVYTIEFEDFKQVKKSHSELRRLLAQRNLKPSVASADVHEHLNLIMRQVSNNTSDVDIETLSDMESVKKTEKDFDSENISDDDQNDTAVAAADDDDDDDDDDADDNDDDYKKYRQSKRKPSQKKRKNKKK